MRISTFHLHFLVFAMAFGIGVASPVFADTVYFPQVVVGAGYTTTILVMNTGSTTVTNGSLLFNDQRGFSHAEYRQTINLSAGGSERFVLTSAGPLTVLSGILVSASGTLDGVATFDLRDGNGTLVTTAGVLGATTGNNFVLPVDLTATVNTGVAIVNTSSAAENITLQLFDENGTLTATATYPGVTPLGSHGQVAAFVTDFFPQLVNTSFKGTLVVSTASSSNTIAATALTIKEGLFSALPVIPSTASSNSGGTGGGTGGNSGGTADVVFSFGLFGGATLQFQGQTFITVGSNPFPTFPNLSPGPYQMTGTLPSGASMILAFANEGGILGMGGVLPGSIQSLQGPSLGTTVSACNVSYVNIGSSSVSYKFQFTVTTSTTAACQTGE